METETEKENTEQKIKIAVSVPNYLLKLIDDASKKHADCGRGVIIRLALYNFFDLKD